MPDFMNQPVPPLLQWIAWAFAVFIPLSLITLWVWKRFMADRWATRSQQAALLRAKILVEQFAKIQELKNDPPRLIATVGLCILYAIPAFGSVMVAIFAYWAIQNEIARWIASNSGSSQIIWSSIIGLAVFVHVATITGARSVYMVLLELKPIMQGEHYTGRFKARLARLLERAGMTPVEAKEFLDARMNAISQDNAPESPTAT